MIIIYTFLVAAYVILTIITTVKIRHSGLLSKRQKIANILINAFIPVLWFWLIRPHLSAATSVMTTAERERLIRKSSGSKLR